MSESATPYSAGGSSTGPTPVQYEDGLPRAVHSEWSIEGVSESSTAPITWDRLLLEDCPCSSEPTEALAAWYENGPARPLYVECQSCGTGRVEAGDGYEIWYEKVGEAWTNR